MRLVAVAAVSKPRLVIGKDNSLPWHIPEDLKRFKSLTMSCPVIMGRKTFESIFAQLMSPLKGRTNIVITSNPAERGANFPSWNNSDGSTRLIFASSTSAAKELAEEALLGRTGVDATAYVIGGASVYEEFLDDCCQLMLTEVKGDFDGDTFFPPIKRSVWRKVSSELGAGSTASLEYTFDVYNRRKALFGTWFKRVFKF